MTNESGSADELVDRLRQGSDEALGELFALFRERLKRIVHFRLDYRLNGRVSESDVIQDAYISASKRVGHFLSKDEMPFFIWLRLLINQQLVDVHRQHLVAEMRDARREVALDGALSAQTSAAIAAQLAGDLISPSQALERAERITALEATINQLNPIDREIIALRHFEELTSAETAAVLKIEKAAASKRYVRAIKRLQELLAVTPGFRAGENPLGSNG